MERVPPEVLARAAVEQVAALHGATFTGELRRDLIRAIDRSLRTAIELERDACVSLCQERHKLWETTADKASTPEALRAEARPRANEAAYLADAIANKRP
jgi:hypothetical protein